jgi:dienelactone hydrolase
MGVRKGPSSGRADVPGEHKTRESLSLTYRKWINSREERLLNRRGVGLAGPFAWGADWTLDWPVDNADASLDEQRQLCARARAAAEGSDRFFAYKTPQDFSLNGAELTFSSAVQTRYPENNTAFARWYPAGGGSKRAVLVLPHWNARAWGYGVLSRLLNLMGISALVVVLPYHEGRKPAGARGAEYAVSANLGRTMQAARQGVSDIRSCADWLESRGFARLGVLGASLGAGYGFLASAHDSRLSDNVFIHGAPSISDVVWTGRATRAIRQALENHIGLEQLRDIWRVIDPLTHVEKFAQHPKRSLLVTARYDTTFLPEHFARVQRVLTGRGLPYRLVSLPCGHYSLGDAPWLALTGYQVCSFLAANL